MIKRTYYGWFDPRARDFKVSLYPADAPIRPAVAFKTKAEVHEMLERKRAKILWWPPLPDHMMGRPNAEPKSHTADERGISGPV